MLRSYHAALAKPLSSLLVNPEVKVFLNLICFVKSLWILLKFAKELIYTNYISSRVEYWKKNFFYVFWHLIGHSFFKLNHSNYTDNSMSRWDTRFWGIVQIFSVYDVCFKPLLKWKSACPKQCVKHDWVGCVGNGLHLQIANVFPIHVEREWQADSPRCRDEANFKPGKKLNIP